MKLSLSFDEGIKAHVLHLSGEADVPIFLNALGGIYKEHDPQHTLNLIFFDDGLTRHLTAGETMAIMDFARTHRPDCPGKTAMVGESDVSYGTFRMAEGMGGDFSEHLQVFRSLDAAREWIGEGESSAGVA